MLLTDVALLHVKTAALTREVSLGDRLSRESKMFDPYHGKASILELLDCVGIGVEAHGVEGEELQRVIC